jgi:membrane-bound lytic murein transglycosylase C
MNHAPAPGLAPMVVQGVAMIFHKQANGSRHFSQRALILRSLLLAVSLVIAPVLQAEEDPFDALDKLLDDNFESIDRSLEEQFEMMDQAMEAAYQRLGKEVEKTWGVDEKKLPSKKEWVDYSQDLKTRRSVDFETGTIEVERIIDIADGAADVIRDMQTATVAIQNDSLNDLAEKDLAMKYARESLTQEGMELKKAPVQSNKPVLQDLAPTVAATEVDKVVKTALTATRNGPVKTGAVSAEVTPLANNKKKVTVRIPLKKGYQAKLAGDYLDEVSAEAKRQNLPPSLLLAVMETESHFNPRARSAVPAYGLMQLVPRSGAMDAYQFVYGEKTLVEPEFLYKPGNNVELGSAYLHILHNRYLRKIVNPLSRSYCAIAAYNTGAGNVAKAFIGTTNISKAAVVINEMEPHEVYEHMKEHLPYEETRRYIVKVTKAQKKYAEYDQHLSQRTSSGSATVSE